MTLYSDARAGVTILIVERVTCLLCIFYRHIDFITIIDPISGAHTQGVEAMWSSCKRMLREERIMHSKLFVTYLPEFMWRRRFGGPSTFSPC